MFRRCRSYLLVFLALAAPIAMPAMAFAQDRPAPAASSAPAPEGSPPAAPPASTRSGSAAPSAPAPSSTTGDDRPPLIAPTPVTSPSPAVVSPAATPARDAQDAQQDAPPPTTRPDTGEVAAPGHEVFSEDWWGRVHPVVELHGYFRTRAELFNNLGLGRHGSVFQGNDPQYLAPLPLDQSYQNVAGATGVSVAKCGPAGIQTCYDETESGANIRFRLNPEIHISDNLRILSQVDLLDNVVLGSTPNSYAMQPAGATSSSGRPQP